MLDLRDLRKNPDFYTAALEKRGKKYSTLVQHFLVQLEKHTNARQKLEKLQAELNTLSKHIPQ